MYLDDEVTKHIMKQCGRWGRSLPTVSSQRNTEKSRAWCGVL